MCQYGDEEVTYSALGYTAHFSRPIFEGTGGAAVAVSLGGHERFADDRIEVDYMTEQISETRTIWHVSTMAHIDRSRRIYEYNEKHLQKARSEGYAATMPLDAIAAQNVLNHAVELSDEERLVARYQGVLYLFPCHQKPQSLHQDSPGCYHGFQIAAADLRKRDGAFYAKLRRHCGWEELL